MRKPHTKSKNGCSQCKRRRVKCDAVRPVCSHCERRQEICEYVDMVIQGPSKLHDNSAPACRLSRSIANGEVDTWLSVIRSVPASQAQPTEQNLVPGLFRRPERTGFDLEFQQLELMHNWYDKTSHTMALDGSKARSIMWESVVPAIALKHPFLMHKLLALSAAHIASGQIEKSDIFLPVAHQHHQLGAEMLKQITMPESIPDAQSHNEATVVYTVMDIVLTLAVVERTGVAEDDLDTFIDWLIHLRSSFRLAHELYKESTSYGESRIAALLRRPEDGPPELSPLDGDMNASLDFLDARSRASTTTSATDKEHITGTIEHVKLWSRLVSLRPQTSLFIATCATDLTDDFFRLVKQRNPAALIAMAHFLVPMCHAPRKWFWGDWFGAAIAAIVKIISINQWKDNLAWVLEQVEVSQFSFGEEVRG